jgi:Protein of unknown function (DUF4236)
MTIRFRMRRKFGPFRINLSRSGVSTSITGAGITVNPRRRSVWANLPGPFFMTHKTPRRGR